jgi:hypothetical protein
MARCVESNDGLLPELRSLSGVKDVTARGRQLVVNFAERDAAAVQRAKDQVIRHLASRNQSVLGYRLHTPDLASAYFNLTGAPIEETVSRGRAEPGKGTNGRHKSK